MAQLGKADLEQVTDVYLQSLGLERLVVVAKNLREPAVDQDVLNQWLVTAPTGR